MRIVDSSSNTALWVRIFIFFIGIVTHTINTQQEKPINQNLQKIIGRVTSLPQQYQPDNLKKSLSLMFKGDRVWTAITKNKLYDSLSLPAISADDARILQQALNSSNDKFWILIHNDAKVQEAINHCNIAFTRDTCASHDYAMLFRITYIRMHITNPDTLHKIQLAYEHAVIALQWFLFAQAILQEDSIFISSMLTTSDPEYYLFRFLDGYAELVSPRYRFYSGLHPHSWWQSNAYTRYSSYWHGKKQFNDSIFGIDFCYNNHKPVSILPGNNAHLLFCVLDNGMTAIKWEEFGVTFNLKKYNFSAIKQFSKYFKINNKQNENLYRKDKVPYDVMLQFKSLFSSNLTKHQSKQILRNGISSMIKILDNNAQQLFINFLTKQKKYSAQTLSLRKGNEIILKPNQFKHLSDS